MLTHRETREQHLLCVEPEGADRTGADPDDDGLEQDGDAHGGPAGVASRDQATIRILFVCTGNVIRSALAERALRQQFELIGADRFHVSSAGTRAAVGQGMWRESVEIARAYGFDYRDFVARQLDDEVLDDVDYVIAAAREHRETVLRRRPDLVHRVFTFRELVRIIDEDASVLDAPLGADPADRWVDLAAWADRHRAAHSALDPEDDDLVDPRDGGREALWTFERNLIRGVVTIVSAVSGERR